MNAVAQSSQRLPQRHHADRAMLVGQSLRPRTLVALTPFEGRAVTTMATSSLAWTCVGEGVMATVRSHVVRVGGRMRRSELLRSYPSARHTADCGLVGQAEIQRMAGYGPTGRGWFKDQVERGMFPPHDGQLVDDRPTWMRETMLVHLYLRRHPHNRRRYLVPDLWPEAMDLLTEMGEDPHTAEWLMCAATMEDSNDNGGGDSSSARSTSNGSPLSVVGRNTGPGSGEDQPGGRETGQAPQAQALGRDRALRWNR